MLDLINSHDKLSKIEERMKDKVLKAEMSALRQAMKKFDSMYGFTVEYADDEFITLSTDIPKRYIHLYFTYPRGTKKKPDNTMRFIQNYVLNDIYTILLSVFPKYRAEFSCVRIDDHQDVWQFDVFHK